MGKYKGLRYSISVPMHGNLKKNHTGGGPATNRYEALVDAGNWALSKLFRQGQKLKFELKLEAVYNKIYNKLKDETGVLVIAQYQQWKHRSEAGNNPQQLLYLEVGPASNTRKNAFRAWQIQQSKGMLKKGPDRGKVLSSRAFLWFTRDLTSSELLERLKNKKEEREYWEPAR